MHKTVNPKRIGKSNSRTEAKKELGQTEKKERAGLKKN